MRISSKFTNGFTLIEMMVSLGVFSVVAVVALGSLVRIMSANQKAQSLHNAITNMSFALDSMSREIRMAGNLTSVGDHTVTFDSMRPYRNPNTGDIDCNLKTSYFLGDDNGVERLKKAEATTCDQPAFTSSDYVDMLSPGITLDGVNSLINVSPSGDGPYQMVMFRLYGSVGTKEKTKTYFDVQTGVSRRISDD